MHSLTLHCLYTNAQRRYAHGSSPGGFGNVILTYIHTCHLHYVTIILFQGIALKLQNRLEESKQKMFMALKIFTEEALIEESASIMGSGCYSFSSSISTASNYSIDSNSISSSCGSADLDGYNIENFMRNDYSSKKREIAKLNVMVGVCMYVLYVCLLLRVQYYEPKHLPPDTLHVQTKTVSVCTYVCVYVCMYVCMYVNITICTIELR